MPPQKQSENCYEAAQYTHKIVQASLDGIITINDRGRVVEFNPSAEQIFGYEAEQVIGQDLADLIIPERLKLRHAQSLKHFIETGEKRIIDKRIEVPAVKASGEEFPVEMTLTSIEQGDSIYITAFLRDLTEKKQAEEQSQIAYTVFSKTSEGIMVTDSNNRIKAVNPAFKKITGYGKEEVLGQNPSLLSSGHHDQKFYEKLWQHLSESGTWEGEVWNRRKNGDIYPQWLSIATVKESGGRVTDHVAVLVDITQRKETEEQIVHQATHDPLTGLPNRILFFDRISQAITVARREEKSIAVLFVDLDGFKPINDVYGHLTGDLMLKEVAQRLTYAVREMDTVARFGGDEFALVLPCTEDCDIANSIAQELLSLIKKPYLIENQQLVIGCSIGIAYYPQDGVTADLLISCADQAMYRAKSNGGNRFEVSQFEPSHENS